MFTENREVGTHVFDEYVTYDEWIKFFDMDSDVPDMKGIEPYHFHSLPVWIDGNAYLAGAASYHKEQNRLIDQDAKVLIELEEKDGHTVFKTNLYELLREFRVGMISSDTLGKAFEPEERYENPDGSDIIFDTDYLGKNRGLTVIPGPFAEPVTEQVVY